LKQRCFVALPCWGLIAIPKIHLLHPLSPNHGPIGRFKSCLSTQCLMRRIQFILRLHLAKAFSNSA
jgi:hypothetical protein